MPLSILSTLPEETEVLIERVIGAALEVHRRLTSTRMHRAVRVLGEGAR